MLTKVWSVANKGLEAIEIEVEVNVASKGFPSFNIVGLPTKAVEEARERVRTALVNTGIKFPQKKITVNLAPADIPKEGSAYDLPIAVGILMAMGKIEIKQVDSANEFFRAQVQSSLATRKNYSPASSVGKIAAERQGLEVTDNISTSPNQVNFSPAFCGTRKIAAERQGLGDDPKIYFYGELGLSGRLRHTKGVFLVASLAREKGVGQIFVPKLSANEGSVVEGVKVFPVSSLKELMRHFKEERKIKPLNGVGGEKLIKEAEVDFDFEQVVGQEQAKRALEIACSGGHNVLMVGPPGSGKTMLARALPGILPELYEEEALEVTKIYSVTGNIEPGGGLIRRRPFRAPHHTTSRMGLIGGGSQPMPGEISLAHRGVLFLDEFAEYPRSILEALRQPLEDGKVSVVRVAGRVTFPARFMLIAAANPCPCGYLNHPKKACKCSPNQILNYQKRMSGPILDRIDIHVQVPFVEVEKLRKRVKGESSKLVRERVMRARKIQEKRFKGEGLPAGRQVFSNSEMKNKQIEKFCELSSDADRLLHQAAEKFQLSARGYFRIIKISRTIADLGGSEKIEYVHVAEALQYRVRE